MSTALVTGATAGIGLAFVRQLAERGHDVVVVARDRARLAQVRDDVARTFGVHVETLPADLTDRAQLDIVAGRLADRDRPVDLLVNNAGFGLRERFLDNDLTAEEQMFDVLCRAVLVLTHAAAPAMVERGHGAIVNVSSVASFVAMGTYSAAKAWVAVFTESLATELRDTGVQALALCPGFTHTEFHQRAGMDLAQLPGWLWLDADQLVCDCLDDIAKGRVVSVPGAPYKALVATLKIVPRGLIRAGMGRAAAKRRST